MTAARRPRRDAATLTFVALPPSDLAKVRTFARGTPSCSGYRSTETRPMVRTSQLAMGTREVPRARDVARRIVRLHGRTRERDVLLEHAPARVLGRPQRREHVGDARVALAQRTKQALRHSLRVRHAPLPYRCREPGVGIPEADVTDA